MRLHLLAIVVVTACAQPQQPPPQYGDPAQGYGYAPPEIFCTALASEATTGSICVPGAERCETERQRAAADGARTEGCRPQSPVACFQLRGDPNPSMEMCAASVEDCELLRLIDHDKNGPGGGACDWRHGPSAQR